jgi:hypothetical protein
VSLLDLVCSAMGVSSPISRHQFERALTSFYYDTSRSRDELSWTPTIQLVKALRKMRCVESA